MKLPKYILALLPIVLVAPLGVTHCEAKTLVSCPDSHYFDSREQRCLRCTSYDTHDPYLVLEAKCTLYHDTMLRCVKGFHYSHDSNGASCHPCSKTCPQSRPFLGKECFGTMDRICCKENETVVRNGKCEKQVFCTENEHLALHERQTNRESCQPCQPGFENPKKKHRDFKCQKKEEANSQENHGHRFSAGSISLMVPLALIVMRFS
ncbi:hypothetical protein PoB_001344700 [Plakobranchus ocellatus]|uniref:TNFR-Cys domain-containing protein n=1 Tax=Plakobranchus ocellatus TaxID=259542 RepID=A0AAV3YVE9_9GAST|nr:hypothetical protein PoB_001344700 [Plakobranchus ocellatus]